MEYLLTNIFCIKYVKYFFYKIVGVPIDKYVGCWMDNYYQLKKCRRVSENKIECKQSRSEDEQFRYPIVYTYNGSNINLYKSYNSEYLGYVYDSQIFNSHEGHIELREPGITDPADTWVTAGSIMCLICFSYIDSVSTQFKPRFK